MNLDMGAYGAYIWPAYAISALALAGLTAWTVTAWRRARAKLAALEDPRAAQPRNETNA